MRNLPRVILWHGVQKQAVFEFKPQREAARDYFTELSESPRRPTGAGRPGGRARLSHREGKSVNPARPAPSGPSERKRVMKKQMIHPTDDSANSNSSNQHEGYDSEMLP